MLGYVFRKIFYGLLVTILVVVVISSIIFLAPVDPVRLTFGQRSDVATVKAKTAELGLERPLHLQLLSYLADISPISGLADTPENRRRHKFLKIFRLSGDNFLVLKKPWLRESFQTRRRVSEMLADAIPATLILAAAAMLIATVLGIGLGIWASLRPNSWSDAAISVVSVFGYSLPSYVAAMLLALVFGFYFSNFSGLEVQGSLFELDDFGEWQLHWRNLVLPAVALGLRPVALITQMTRSSMLDILSADFVRTARAKGLSKWSVVVRHALRNALNPVISAVSGWLAGLLAGAFFVETVFNFKGLGSLTVTALLNFDLPVVLGAVLFTSLVFVVLNLLTDIFYAFADPRVRLA